MVTPICSQQELYRERQMPSCIAISRRNACNHMGWVFGFIRQKVGLGWSMWPVLRPLFRKGVSCWECFKEAEGIRDLDRWSNSYLSTYLLMEVLSITYVSTLEFAQSFSSTLTLQVCMAALVLTWFLILMRQWENGKSEWFPRNGPSQLF